MSRLLQDVTGELSKLPGIGRRTALRLAIHLLRMEPDSVSDMTRSIDRFRRDIKYCKLCNNLSDEEICPICADRERDHTTVCVVEQVADVLSIENTPPVPWTLSRIGRCNLSDAGHRPFGPEDRPADRADRPGNDPGSDPRHLDLGRRRNNPVLSAQPAAPVPAGESHVDRPGDRLRRRTGIRR